MLTSALDHYRSQQRILAAGAVAARKARRRGALATAQVVTAYQFVAVKDALAGVDRMLEEQEIDAPQVASVAPAAFVGTASDGRPLDTLLDFDHTDQAFATIVATQLKDMARMAVGTSMTTRPEVTGYTRMLNPPSCSRCTVLAGRRYRYNAGFDRHPGCDCLHVPTKYERTAEQEGLILDQDAYFNSLPKAEQNRIFTKAGAEAIRDGANLNQVVNARRGMDLAQIGGRDALISREGVTRRGLATRARTGRNMASRLMPESIYANARSRDDALRMLKLHGYIL